MNIPYTNWQAVFFDLLVAGLVVFSLFRLLRYLLPLLFVTRKRKQILLRTLPVVETVVWILYLSWYTFRFAEIRSVFTVVVMAVLLVLLFWISRFFIKDLLAGIFFMVSGRFREEEVIIHESMKGTIKSFRMLSLEIETQEGQILYIPYSKLLDSSTTKHESTEQSAAYTFTLITPDKQKPEQTTASVRLFLVSLPWSSSLKTPQIIVREHSPGHYRMEITVYPIEKTFGKRIEQMTLERFSLPG